MDTSYHIWLCCRDEDGTLRSMVSMERDDTAYPTGRKADCALPDGRQYWKAGQVLQCVDRVFCQPMHEEFVDRGMPFGPKGVAIEQFADQAKFIRLAAKQVLAMRQRGELDAAGRIMSLESVRAELAERQRRSRPTCSSRSPGKKISSQRFKVIFSRRRQPVIAHLTGTFLGISSILQRQPRGGSASTPILVAAWGNSRPQLVLGIDSHTGRGR